MCTGVPPDLCTDVFNDHNYSKTSKPVETPHTQKPTICHSTLSSSSSSHDSCLSKAAATKNVEYGGTVNLLSSDNREIGTAVIVSGKVLHGVELPH